MRFSLCPREAFHRPLLQQPLLNLYSHTWNQDCKTRLQIPEPVHLTDLSFPWDKPKLKYSDHSITGESPPKQEMEHERQRNQSIWKNVPLSDQYQQTQMMWVGRIKDRRYLGRKSLQTEKSVVKTSFNLTFYKNNQIILNLGVIQIQKDKLLRNRKLFQHRARK